jgi:hypothetical protein
MALAERDALELAIELIEESEERVAFNMRDGEVLEYTRACLDAIAILCNLMAVADAQHQDCEVGAYIRPWHMVPVSDITFAIGDRVRVTRISPEK